jgi:DNA repair photolyase
MSNPNVHTTSDIFTDAIVDTTNLARAPRPASGALTKTGGFLAGFTHTLQPYIGCVFGCAYCYVQGLGVHQFHQPALAWGDYVHPRVGIAERLRVELGRYAKRGTLGELAIFMSSATDPYQGAERKWRLSRACLDVMLEFPPGLLVMQTRSPLVEEDFARIKALGTRCWLNFTLETDRDDVRKALTPRCPSIACRLATLAEAKAQGLQTQITVSPCLPYSDGDAFATLLAHCGTRVVVDSYVSGDGNGGRRTARTTTGSVYAEQGWGDWRAEEAARALYDALVAKIGTAAGWSQAGFIAVTTNEFHRPIRHKG